MKDLFKKYGVLVVIGCILVGFIGFYAYDTSKDKIKGKTSNGKAVVYSVNGTDVNADDFYDKLYETYGDASIYSLFEKAVLDQAVETTDEMKELAEYNASTIISNYESSYGDTYEEEIASALKSIGYSGADDLEQYLIDQQKFTQLLNEYIENDPDGKFAAYMEEYKPRVLSHILVSMEDPDNPTEEELAKVAEIDAALEAGDDFATVATNYSDDSSASSGGSLGWSDSTSSYVAEFLEASLALEEGEVSDWVKTQYGYHKIKCDACTYETLKEEDDFLSNVLTADASIQGKALWDKAEEVGLTMDDELKAKLRAYMGLED